jgi:hypothetical protein
MATRGDTSLMEFRDLLRREKLTENMVLVFRHRPREKELRKVLPWLAEADPAVFNAYQQAQTRRVEKQMQRAQYVASFIGHEARKALFIGLYEQRGWKTVNAAAMKKGSSKQSTFCIRPQCWR